MTTTLTTTTASTTTTTTVRPSRFAQWTARITGKMGAYGFTAALGLGAIAALAANGVEGRVLAVLRPEDEAIWKSLRNLDNVHICGVGELNAYDVLVSDWIVFTPDTLPVDRKVTRGTHGTPAESTEEPS